MRRSVQIRSREAAMKDDYFVTGQSANNGPANEPGPGE
jgi:hypothetical protein